MSETTPRRKRGRPATDHSDLVGSTIQGFLVLKVRLVDSEVKVDAKCPQCNTISHPRLRDINSEHSQTCGCLRAKVYTTNCNKAVDQLSPDQLALIWETRSTGTSRRKTCAKFGLPYGHFDSAFRRYQTSLDELAASDHGRQMVTDYQKPHSSMALVAEKFKLSVTASQYVINGARRRLRQQMASQEDLAQNAEWIVQAVESRRHDRREGKPGELTLKELRRAKGRMLGSLASLHNECCSAIAGLIPQHEQRLIQEFLDLATYTLAQRLARQGAWRKQDRRKRDKEFMNIFAQV
jgi:hypothetical protein